MKHWRRTFGIAIGAGLLTTAVFLAPEATAQTGGSYSLRATIASGGTITGGAYRLNNAVGQSPIGVSAGGVYELRAGILPATTGMTTADATETTPRVFLPAVQR